jgi:membrane protein DedA with SNARE-associated domain
MAPRTPAGGRDRPTDPASATSRAGRIRFLPLSVALGLFVGDVLTLSLRGDLTVARTAVAALRSAVAYAAVRWWLRRRGEAVTRQG